MSWKLQVFMLELWDIFANMNKRRKRRRRGRKKSNWISNTAFRVVVLLFSVTIIGGVIFCFVYSTLDDSNVVNEEKPTQEIIADAQFADRRSENADTDDSSEDIISENNYEKTLVQPEHSKEEILENQIDEMLYAMSLDEKIYQLFIVTPEMLTGVSQVVAAGETTKNSLEKTPVGGLVYFASNFVSVDQTKEMLSNTQKYAEEIEGMPLFLCVDDFASL